MGTPCIETDLPSLIGDSILGNTSNSMSKSKSPSQPRYPPELRERAVRMVREAIAENGGDRFGVVTRVARQLGIGPESLRNWVKQVEIDDGKRPGVTSEERRRIAELEKENRAPLTTLRRRCVAPAIFSIE